MCATSARRSARADARRNEPLETVVRLVRGDPPTAPSRPTSRARTASSASTTSPWPTGGSGRRAAPRSSPALVVGSQDGERILDVCSAPGGKTTQLHGDVTAVELDPNRASELDATSTARRNERHVVEADGTKLPPGLSGFDRALVDAPCSGLGVLSQRPDLRWRAKPLPELQLALLRSAAERVRPGGTIVYSVCTINADENEAIVDASGPRVAPLTEDGRSTRIRVAPSSC